MSNRCRIDRNGVKFFLYSKCRVGFETKWGKEEEGEARERERKRGRCIFTWPFPKEKEGWIGRSVCVYGKWKEGKRERERARGCVECNAETRERKRKRKRGEREAVTDQLPRNTNSCRCSTKWRPPLLNLFTPTSTPNYPLLHPAPVFPIVLFDTRPPAPIDLGSLKTRWKPPTTAFAGAA